MRHSQFFLPATLGGALAQLCALDISCNVEISNVINTSVRFHKRSQSHGPANDTEHYSENSSLKFPGSLRRNSFPSRSENDLMVDVKSMENNTPVGQRLQKKCLRVPIAMYSFGQPRLGNGAFARLYKLNVPHSFRVVAEGDIVTSIPFASCHAGISLYKHAGLEVALDEGA